MQLPTRRQLTLLLVLLSASFSFSQTRATITGNVTSITGVVATSGIVQFTLAPFSTAINYRVNGVTVLDPIIAQCSIDSSGNIKDSAGTGSCLVWGNDNITPANTCYQVGFNPNGAGYDRVLQGVQITGATVDLSSPTFCPSVRITPEQAVVMTEPADANIIPSVDNFFNVGAPTFRYSHGYFNTLTVSSCTGCAGVSSVSGTSPIAISGGSTPAISIANAAADGTTKGAASFTAADFDASSGVISLDYANGQKATTLIPGFLSAADWTTFNGKGSVSSVATTSPITGGPFSTTGTIACATCVTSSVPGAGLAHFAGGTQAATSSAADLSSADVTGNLGVTHLNSGTSASGSTFWRGDGSWATPTGAVIPTGTGFTHITSGAQDAASKKVDLSTSADVTGNLGVANLNSGTGASASTVWCGNATWCTPSTGAGADLVQTFCTGTATSSVTRGMYPWGAAAMTTSTCAVGYSSGSELPLARAGTIKNLSVKCATGGSAAGSGVFTVMKNNASAGVTCTVGTGTTCSDTSNTNATAANDTVGLQFTTQAAETLANCRASFEIL